LHFTRLAWQRWLRCRQFPTALHCNLHLNSFRPANKHTLTTQPIPHTIPHTIQALSSSSASEVLHLHHSHLHFSATHANSHTSTTLPHITSHIMATGIDFPYNQSHLSIPTLTAYSELAQRLREEQPRAIQRPLRVRDHLRVPRASAEGPRVEAHLRRLRHLVSRLPREQQTQRPLTRSPAPSMTKNSTRSSSAPSPSVSTSSSSKPTRQTPPTFPRPRSSA